MGMQSGIINIIISSFYVFIFLNQVNSTLTFVDPTDQGPSPATISYSAVAYSFLSNPTFSVTARILDLSKQKYCEEDSSFSGSILFVNDAAGCSEEYKIRMCERVGCVGIVAVEAFMVPGYSMRRFKSAETKQKNDLNVPYVIIGLHDGAQLQDFMNHYDTSPLSSNLTNPNQRFLITINSGETNEWEVFVSSTVFIIIWRVIEPLFALSCIVLADWRMWILYKRGRLTGIAAFCLIMQMFSNAIRFLYWAVDPTFSSQIYNWFWSRLFMFVHIPFQIIAAVMIIREWILALKKSRLRISFLSERGISGFFYFSVASLLLLILIELIDSFISGAYFDYNWLSVFTIALETITLLILAIAFFTVSRITLRALNMANASESKTRRNRVRRMANWSIVTASGMLSFVVASIFAMIDELRGNPIGFHVIMLFWMFGLQITSIGTAMTFVGHSNSNDKHNSDSRSKNRDSMAYGTQPLYDSNSNPAVANGADQSSKTQKQKHSETTSTTDHSESEVVSVRKEKPQAPNNAGNEVNENVTPAQPTQQPTTIQVSQEPNEDPTSFSIEMQVRENNTEEMVQSDNNV